MDELAADLRAFLLNHPFLQLTDSKKVRQLNPPDYAKPPTVARCYASRAASVSPTSRDSCAVC